MKPRNPCLVALLNVVVACWGLVFSSPAHAGPLPGSPEANTPLQQPPKQVDYAVEVLVLHATNAGGGIDKRVGDMPELKKPPFSSYDTYRLLGKTRLPLVKGEPQTFHLPNQRILKTELKESQGETFKITASINQPKGKAFLPLLEVRAGLGQSFIVAGQTFKEGILVLVLRVVKVSN